MMVSKGNQRQMDPNGIVSGWLNIYLDIIYLHIMYLDIMYLDIIWLSYPYGYCNWLVVWNMNLFFHVLGMSSSQLLLTHIFQRGRSTTNQITFMSRIQVHDIESFGPETVDP